MYVRVCMYGYMYMGTSEVRMVRAAALAASRDVEAQRILLYRGKTLTTGRGLSRDEAAARLSTSVIRAASSQVLGRWLPAKWARQAALSRRWEQLQSKYEQTLQPRVTAGGASEPRHVTLLKEQMDCTLLAVLASVDPDAGRRSHALAPAGVGGGHSPEAVARAVEHLAGLRAPGTRAADLLLAKPAQHIDLLALLHHERAAAVRLGLPAHV